MLSPGIWECKVLRALWSESSQKHTPCIAVQAEIDDIEGPQKLWGSIYVTDKTVGDARRPGLAVQQLRALGYKGRLSELHPEPKALVGLSGKCVVEEKQNGGLRIARFGVDQGMQTVAMELSKLEALDKQFGEEPSVASFDKQQAADKKKAAPAPAPADDEPPTDEDIPF